MIERLITNGGIWWGLPLVWVAALGTEGDWRKQMVRDGWTPAVGDDEKAVGVCQPRPGQVPTMPYGGLVLWMATGRGRRDDG